MIVDERRDEAHGYRHAYIHCRYNRVVGVAAYGRAALRWRRTIGRQRRLRMRYSMASPSSATQGRCNSVGCRAGLAAMVEGRLRTLDRARVYERTVCHELKVC